MVFVAVEFKGELKREIKLRGVEGPVTLYLTATGAQMAVPGSRKRISISWDEVAQRMHTPLDVPAFLHREPIKLLRHQAQQRELRQDSKVSD